MCDIAPLIYANCYMPCYISKRQEKLCKSGFIARPRRQTHPHPRHQTALWHGARYVRVIRITGDDSLASSSSGPSASLAFLVSLMRSSLIIQAVDGRKPQVPSSGPAVQVHTEGLVVGTCQGVIPCEGH